MRTAELEEEVARDVERRVAERERVRGGEVVLPRALELAELSQHVSEMRRFREVRLEDLVRVGRIGASPDGTELRRWVLDVFRIEHDLDNTAARGPDGERDFPSCGGFSASEIQVISALSSGKS